ncbi:DUF6482 family protein [Porticoccus sp. W117]|uniref:DUF6482 family protein n=1 Tax=Porticoccus sp. W117 TaxID=3054777 RepID=UPI00259AB931|nr:DUF6482 family protein [Porticoccus sp. W117]MDM3869959.1 DUF6482 family protein [Porticoccus sp. W117]
MKKIKITQLLRQGSVEELLLHSLDGALYVVQAKVNDRYYSLSTATGKEYSRRSIEDIKNDFSGIHVEAMWLIQQSAYDEMVGQPVNTMGNGLRVPLSPKPVGEGCDGSD